jgi:PTS system fructose-specific IIA component
MTLAHFTEPNLLVANLRGEKRDGAIAELSKRLERAGRVKRALFFARAVLSHESLVSTVFDGIAFPLARTRAVTELSFAIGLSQQGILWGTKKARTVCAVVLFAVPPYAEQAYASLAVSFASFLKDETALRALRGSGEPGEILALLKQAPLLHTGPQLGTANY